MEISAVPWTATKIMWFSMGIATGVAHGEQLRIFIAYSHRKPSGYDSHYGDLMGETHHLVMTKSSPWKPWPK